MPALLGGSDLPPRVREVKRLLMQHGYTVQYPGRGDHTVFYNPTTGETYSLAGADSREMSRGAWKFLKKKARAEVSAGMEYAVVVEYDSEVGNYWAASPDLPDVHAVGETADDAIERWQHAARGYLAFMSEIKRDVPPPTHRVLLVTL